MKHQPDALKRAVRHDSLNGIAGAGRVETAAAWQPGADKGPV